jgi:SAM-dependent methyltransferase
MDPSHLDELIQLEDSYWWHIAKRRLVTSLVAKYFPPPDRIVEGGIGSCRNLEEFQRRGYTVTGFDILSEAVAHGRQRGLHDLRTHDLSQPWPLEDESTGAVVLLDVLEHLEDPVTVLRHARQILKAGGGIVFTVPAYPWLFSDWDKRLGHFRRYTTRDIRSQAEQADLKVTWLNRWNAFSMPAAVAVRGYQRCFPTEKRAPEFPRVGPIVNQTLLSLASAERWAMRKTKLPFGLSLVGVLKK